MKLIPNLNCINDLLVFQVDNFIVPLICLLKFPQFLSFNI